MLVFCAKQFGSSSRELLFVCCFKNTKFLCFSSSDMCMASLGALSSNNCCSCLSLFHGLLISNISLSELSTPYKVYLFLVGIL